MALRKKRWTIEQINAWKTAYGKPYSRQDVTVIMAKPFCVAFLITYLCFYCWWFSLIAGMVGAWYGYRQSLPIAAKREYEAKAFAQRNKFINNMTQLLANEGRPVIEAIQIMSQRSTGVFRDQLLALVTGLYSASTDQKHAAFDSFRKPYGKDIWFVQYVDQLERACIDGRDSVDGLKKMMTFHNGVKRKQDKYLEDKQKKIRNSIILYFASVTLMAFTYISVGWQDYVKIDAHHPAGWVINGVYLLIVVLMQRALKKRGTDDDLMEIEL